MNEIHGFGPMQPLRPSNLGRPQAPAATPEVSVPTSRDEVNLRLDLPEVARPEVSPETPALLNKRPAAQPETPRYSVEGGVFFTREDNKLGVQDFDGFLVASGAGSATVSTLTPQIQVSGLGPIAVIEEPSLEASGLQFPELSLNGPATAQEGLFALGGQRLA